jgi:hypothetical protein
MSSHLFTLISNSTSWYVVGIPSKVQVAKVNEFGKSSADLGLQKIKLCGLRGN